MKKHEREEFFMLSFIVSCVVCVVFLILCIAIPITPIIVITTLSFVISIVLFMFWIINIETVEEKIKREQAEQKEKERSKQDYIKHIIEETEQRRKIKLLRSDGTMELCSEHACMDNRDNTDDKAYVAICEQDKKHYHLCLYCYKEQPYKETFNYWVSTPLLEARAKGLTLCPKCEYNLLPNKEKVSRLLKNKLYKVVRLIGSGSKKCQDALWLKQPADKCFIVYDLDKDKYFVLDEYKGKPCEKIGAIPSKAVEQLSNFKIENLDCFIYSNEINDKSKYVCCIAIILEDLYTKDLYNTIDKVAQ